MIRTELKAESEAESLSTNIDNSLLRGVPASLVLRGFGASLRTREFRQADYLQSTAVPQLDDFISHDWASGWFGKTIALCLLYNSWPAALASLSLGLVLAALQSKFLGVFPTFVYVTRFNETRPYGFLCEVVCPIVFVLVFIFWQDVRGALRLRATMLFLDKYCIDQEDECRKAAGIAGLGGFLRHTDRLVICWTPRYLTRLWCTYEMASWLYLQKPMHHVEFLPLSHAKGVVLLGLMSVTVSYVYALVMVCCPRLEVPLLTCSMCLIFPLGAHLLRRLVHEVRKLPEQLGEFCVANAGCFCCENNHCLPGESQPSMACDRVVVYETLKGWFRDDLMVDRASSSGLLSDFDTEVREFFGPWVLRKAGPTELPYKLIALIGLPYLYRGLDSLVFIDQEETPASSLRRSLIEYPTLAFAILPVAYKSTLHFTTWVDWRVGIPHNPILDFLTTVVCGAFPACMVILLWAPMTFGNNASLALGLVFAGLDAAVAVVLFRGDLARWRLLACMGWSPQAVPPRTGLGWRARPRGRRHVDAGNGGSAPAAGETGAAAPAEAPVEAQEADDDEDLN